MSNTDKARQILILRYSQLSNRSVEKIMTTFQYKPIDDVIKKHEKALIISIVMVVIVIVTLTFLFISLYSSTEIPYSLIPTLLFLLICLRAVQLNSEIKYILKVLKEIGVR